MNTWLRSWSKSSRWHGIARDSAPGDATLAARLVNTACLRFSHPRLIVEFEQDPEPTIDQMIGFCLAALTTQAQARRGVPTTHLVSGSTITKAFTTHDAIRLEARKNQWIEIVECEPFRRFSLRERWAMMNLDAKDSFQNNYRNSSQADRGA